MQSCIGVKCMINIANNTEREQEQLLLELPDDDDDDEDGLGKKSISFNETFLPTFFAHLLPPSLFLTLSLSPSGLGGLTTPPSLSDPHTFLYF